MTLNQYTPFLNTSIVLPDVMPKEQSELAVKLVSLFNDFALKINNRSISTYSNQQVSTGKIYPAVTGLFQRFSYRKQFRFPNIIAAGTTSLPHGITPYPTEFTLITGTITLAATPISEGIPTGGADAVAITVDAANVNIICSSATYNGGTAEVTLEYLVN